MEWVRWNYIGGRRQYFGCITEKSLDFATKRGQLVLSVYKQSHFHLEKK
jgi:hypothetical protein